MGARQVRRERERLTATERAGALAGALLLFGIAGWITAHPPERTVALDGCEAASNGCTVAVDGDFTTLSAAIVALGGLAAVLSLLGVRFTSLKAAGVELGVYQAQTAGLPAVASEKRVADDPETKATASSSPAAVPGDPGPSPLRVDVVNGLGTELGVVPVATTRLDAPMNQAQAPFLRDYQGAVRASRNGWFITHLLGPPANARQQYSVAIKVTAHRASTGEVAAARFYLGRAWGHAVFNGSKGTDGRFGITTEAFGPFLVLCEVEFASGDRIVLDHYCDFEMGSLVAR